MPQKLRYSTIIASLCWLGLFGTPSTLAQPILPAPDGTGTSIILNGNQFNIGGGTLSGDGANLFHSFEQFGLEANQIANFLTTPRIQNILGRVVGGNPSIINGIIQISGGNSNLYLMNPAGIIFGSGATLNVAGDFFATTATGIGLSNNNWFDAIGSNNYPNLIGNPTTFAFDRTQIGAILNEGNLNVATGQTLGLIGGNITNNGQLSAPEGHLIIAAVEGTNRLQISQPGSILKLEIEAPRDSNGNVRDIQALDLPNLLTGNDAHLLNRGELSAGSGQINLTARVVENRGQIRAEGNTGGKIEIQTANFLDTAQISADGSTGSGGEIRLNYSGTAIQTANALTSANGATSGGTVEFNGSAGTRLTASGRTEATGEMGGSVRLLAENISLLAAQVEATGKSGGGEILVGGDFQGQTQGGINAQNTLINPATTLNVDALTTGKGGRAIVWSQEQTEFYGSISARGGQISGDGGLLEVSGKNQLTFGGLADASASNGSAGQLLLDPKNIIIADPSDPNQTGASFQLFDPNPAAGNFFGQQTVVLTNGNLVISSPFDDLIADDAGAVYLFDSNTGAVLGQINGAVAGDRFGFLNFAGGNPDSSQISALPNGNYAFGNFNADIGGIGNAGTVILANGTTGAEISRISGAVAGDRFGRGDLVVLPNGNYVFGNPDADIAGVMDAGTVILANGTTGAEISRISGINARDLFGRSALAALPNSNYVFGSPDADIAGVANAGTVILTNGTTGAEISRISGVNPSDFFGNGEISALPNGNYVFGNWFADIGGITNAGTVILANGTTGGEISRISGVNPNDQFSRSEIAVLPNGNYVFGNASADIGGVMDAGTVILANGTTGGEISRLSGVNPDDQFGSGRIAVLPNGNYVSRNLLADIGGVMDVGTAILVNGMTGAEISRISGVNPGDQFGSGERAVLPNANYVFGNPSANIGGVVNAGTVILANGTTGGEISRLSGVAANDQFGRGEIVALSNDNYIFGNPFADINGVANAGTAILANGTTGEEISRLSGAAANDQFGRGTFATLPNGNYLIASPNVSNNAGRVDIGIANPNTLTHSYFANRDITIAPALITQITNKGTEVTLQANNDITLNSALTFDNPNGNGGHLTFQAGRSLLLNSNIVTDNGNLTLIANSPATNGTVNLEREPGNAVITAAPGVTLNSGTGATTIILDTGAGLTNNSSGEITLNTLIAGTLAVENRGATGGISLNETATVNGTTELKANGNITTQDISTNGSRIAIATNTGSITTGNLTTASVNGGGEVALNAANTITTGNINASSTSSNGGRIALTSTSDSVVAGHLTSSGATNGGEIRIEASTQITAGQLDSSSPSGAGGNVTLDPSGDIQVSFINAQGGTTGGTVDITTGRFFRATDTFSATDGSTVSISTIGDQSGGKITLRHGGNGITPFEVGDASVNGTTAAITSGQFNIAPFESFPFTEIRGNIGIISISSGINPVDLTQLTTTSINPLRVNLLNENRILVDPIVAQLEAKFTQEFENYLGLSDSDSPTSNSSSDSTSTSDSPSAGSSTLIKLDQAQKALRDVEAAAGAKPAIIYVFFVPSTIVVPPESNNEKSQTALAPSAVNPPQTLWQFNGQGFSSSIEAQLAINSFPPQPTDKLELVLVTASGQPIRRPVNITREEVMAQASSLRSTVVNPIRRTAYLPPAQQMYRWLIAPLEEDLKAQNIDNLVFVMEAGLRSIPLAALHDGNGFIVENYSIGLMPSLSLSDTSYTDVRNASLLAMGAEEFAEQSPLPAVPAELGIITGQLWQGSAFLNEEFTLTNLKEARARNPYGIIHLATHGEFRSGKPSNSYIQLGDARLALDQLRTLGWHDPPVELLVLSACRTALGDEEAELGFAGLAVAAGVKSALGSLWYVSDAGTLGLMTMFYEQLREVPIKAEALRRAQLAMIKGEVRIKDGELITPHRTFPLPPELGSVTGVELSHPYYWSAFTMIGNPW